MAKSEIIRQLVNDEISLKIALDRVKVITFELDNKELQSWLDKESRGYGIDDDIPNYRIITSREIKYSGINFNVQLTRVSFPFEALPKDIAEKIENFHERESISVIESRLAKNSFFQRNLMGISGWIFEKTGTQCTSVYQEIDSSPFHAIIENTRSILILILLNLEKEFGNLDDLDINIESKNQDQIAKINKVLLQQINFIDQSISVGDYNKISGSIIGNENED